LISRIAALLLLLGLFAAGDAKALEPCPPLATTDTSASSCVDCHIGEKNLELCEPVVQWKASVHAAAGISCDACHGGDPFADTAAASHDEEQAGFVGTPGWFEVPDSCGGCHESLMDAHQRGVLGQSIATGQRASVCTTCHTAHLVEPPAPSEILSRDRCGDCEEFQRLAARWHDRFSAVLTDLAPLQDRLDVSRELGEIRELRRESVLAMHSFDEAEVSTITEQTETGLENAELKTRRFEVKASSRERLGLVLAGSLFMMGLATQRLASDRHRGSK
jgi:hypothetical protein